MVDTNVLVAAMMLDDENHDKAVAIWHGLEHAFVPFAAMQELSFYFVKNGIAIDVLSKVISDAKVKVVENNLDDLSFLVRNASKVASYDDVTDLLIFSVSRRLGVKLETFDKDLAKLSGFTASR